MPDHEATLRAIETIYDAASAPERWPDALLRLRDLAEGRAAALMIVDDRALLTEVLIGADQSLLGKMAEVIEENLWLQRAHRAPASRFVPGEQLASAEEIRRTAFYSDLLRPADVFHIAGGAFYRRGKLTGTLSISRPENGQPFATRELDLLNAAAPHIQRAMRITGMLQGLDLYSSHLAAAVDCLSFGFLLLDDQGRILFANAEAERLLGAGRLGSRPGRRVAAPTQGSPQQLEAFLARVIQLREAAGTRFDDGVGPGLRLTGVPLPRRRSDFGCLAPAAVCAVFVFDEVATPPSPMRLIGELYRLTPAEVRLVEALLKGDTLAEYGERTGHSRNTLKVQLGSVFAKTGTARQSELMRHLARLSSVVPRQNGQGETF